MSYDINTSFSTDEEDWWTFSVDDPAAIHFSPFPWFSKVNLSSKDKGEMGTCMSPYGFVSNLNCPEETPFCNCYKTEALIPKLEESPETFFVDYDTLDTLKAKSMECYYIKQAFKNDYKKWFGVDIGNSRCLYNCWEPISPKTGYLRYEGVSGGTGFKGQSSPDLPFPYATRKGFVDGDLIYTLDSVKEFPGLTANGVTSAEYFKYYLEYSKTNATFWNTPKETPLYRKAQTTLLTYQRIKITVNGKFEVKPGCLINIEMPTGESKNITKTRFSGRWMVYKVQRIITGGRHSMILYLMRDGQYINPDRDAVSTTTGKGNN